MSLNMPSVWGVSTRYSRVLTDTRAAWQLGLHSSTTGRQLLRIVLILQLEKLEKDGTIPPGAKEELAAAAEAAAFARFNGVNVVAVEVAVKKATATITEAKRIVNREVSGFVEKMRRVLYLKPTKYENTMETSCTNNEPVNEETCGKCKSKWDEREKSN
ncbi:hypothetical protein GALMADRAFT_215348 [Galerina marginata CBS 339.88]|uniref:Uncharacterized protein n=1 Tax=Galerina marginata (strain CBS 339.88) TaxID=685588 RepID=A0A067SG98_GALM3|nr:hypothetical protein GALMADRAFT_215348 [Galerina marginata CBS 339.88]